MAEATLDTETQQRVLDKLDDVVSDEFRDPPDFAKPLTGAKPWQSLRSCGSIVKHD